MTAMLDPTRGDMIAVLGETTGGPALQRMHTQMKDCASGRLILKNRPRIRKGTVESWNLELLPDGSLGRAYLDFMQSHGYDADSRAEVQYVESEELAYVLQRYREVHDFLHILCGLPPTVLGELGLKWYELVQTQLPMTALSALVGPLRLSGEEAAVFRARLVPWAASAGRHAVPLLTIPLEELLGEPLHEVRRAYRIEPAPDLKALLSQGRAAHGSLPNDQTSASTGRLRSRAVGTPLRGSDSGGEHRKPPAAARGPVTGALRLLRKGASAVLGGPTGWEGGSSEENKGRAPSVWGSWRA
jgi:ubiquinone biosynthesis protein COQ4